MGNSISSELEKYLIILDSYKDCMNESDYYKLYQLGKSLDYRDRVIYDCKLDSIIKKSSFDTITAMVHHEDKMVSKLIQNNELNYILSYIEDMIRSADTLRPELLNYLKKNRDNIPLCVMDTVYDSIIHSLSTYYPHVREEEMEYLKNVIISNCCNDGYSLLDIRYFDSGSYTKVFKIGDKIIKISYKRLCHEIPFSDRILLPYFKGSIGPDYVEITDYINKDLFKVEGREEVYKVYKELRDQGINWIDADETNLLRIPKKVLDRQNSKKYLMNQNEIISNPNYIKNELRPGDAVIVDLDHMLFDYELSRIEDIRQELHQIRLLSVDFLEEKYNREKEESKVKKIGS